MHRIFSTEADAIAFRAYQNTKLGYPKAGVNVGIGFHATKSQGYTVHSAQIVKHPTDDLWSVEDLDSDSNNSVDAGVDAVDNNVVVISGGNRGGLTRLTLESQMEVVEKLNDTWGM